MPEVLVVNSGSSSIKYQLIETDGPTRLAKGVVERIGQASATATHGRLVDGSWVETRTDTPVAGHHDGLRLVVDVLDGAGLAAGITAIGHRVVHGGERFVEPVRIDTAVIENIRDQIPLAPLHTPATLAGIEVARLLWPDVPQVAVFDTAFHATLEPHAYRYAVPNDWYARHRVRRYGFHGTSHAYVARQAAAILDRPLSRMRLITAHLGNGASITAIAGGRSVD